MEEVVEEVEVIFGGGVEAFELGDYICGARAEGVEEESGVCAGGGESGEGDAFLVPENTVRFFGVFWVEELGECGVLEAVVL